MDAIGAEARDQRARWRLGDVEEADAAALAANARTNAAPMPEPPPETNTVRPARSRIAGREWGLARHGRRDQVFHIIHITIDDLPVQHRVESPLRNSHACEATSRSSDGSACSTGSSVRSANGRTSFGAWLISGAPDHRRGAGCGGLRLPRRRHGAHAARDAPDGRHVARHRGNACVRGRPHAVERHGDDQARARRRRADGADAVRAERGGGAARGLVHALSARRRPRRGGMHRGNRWGTVPELFQVGRGRRAVRDGADRDAGSTRAPAGNRRGARHRFDLHRSRGPVGVDGPPRRHRPRRRAGHAARRRRAVQGSSASPSASSAPIPTWWPKYVDYGFNWIAIGSDMAFMVEPRAGVARQGARARGAGLGEQADASY